GVAALDLGSDATIPVALPTTDTLTALVYPLGLDAFHLAPGPIPLPSAREPSRPIPGGASVFRAAPGTSDEPRAWRVIDPADLGAAITRLRLPGLAPGACEDAGGCFRRVDGLEGCEVPCDEPEPPALPIPPAPAAQPHAAELPRFAPCPDGWSLRAATSTTSPDTCDPPASLAATCPMGQWPDPSTIPAGATRLYAAPDAAPGGTGTQGSPFASVAEAIAALPRSGGVVVLARGAFPERLSLTRSATLVGTCAEGSSATSLAGIEARAGVVRVSNLRVDATTSPALGAAGEGTTLVLDRVAVDGGEDHANGLFVEEGAEARATDLVLRGTGRAIWAVDRGSNVEVSRLDVDDVLRNALYVLRGARLSVDSARVRGVRVRGLETRAAAVSLARVHFEDVAQAGVRLAETSTVTLTDVWVDGVGAEQAIDVLGDGRLDGERLLVTNVAGTGVRVVSARARLVDVTARELVRSEGLAGEGLLVQDSTVTVERIAVVRASGRGIAIEGSGPADDVVLRDVDVRDTRPRVEGDESGLGLSLSGTSLLTLVRARIAGSAAAGVDLTTLVDAPRAQAVEDLTIDGARGPGVVLRGSGRVSLARVSVEATGAEAIVSWGAEVVLEDVDVARTTFGPRYVGGRFDARRVRVADTRSAGLLGDPAVVGQRPVITLEDVEVLRAGHFGLVIKESAGRIARARFDGNVAVGACLDASDLDVEDLIAERTVRPREPLVVCNDPQSVSDTAVGVSLRGRSDLTVIFYLEASLRRFVLRANADRGLDIGPFSRVELRDGVVEGHPVGIVIRDQSPEDLAVEGGVIFRDNGESLRVVPTGS
ncbi:hypothetical protein L6R52_38495, partial [Myxococcota bacterium]|nr:hypothetical protein [Myxococcota bacterium]